MEIKELIEGLNNIIFDLCPQCSPREDEGHVIDEIIEKLQVFDELKKKRFEAYIERKSGNK